MAEREGFEPPIELPLCLISSQVHSTGLCHLSAVMVTITAPLIMPDRQSFRRAARPRESPKSLVNSNLMHESSESRSFEPLVIAKFVI